jgi:hypothetical protein
MEHQWNDKGKTEVLREKLVAVALLATTNSTRMGLGLKPGFCNVLILVWVIFLIYFQLGPNVSIGAGAVIGAGVRIRESIVLSGATILDHSLVLYSIVGHGSHVGQWTRVEGTPCDPNPNKPFAKMENPPLFNCDGRLNPSITILGEMP